MGRQATSDRAGPKGHGDNRTDTALYPGAYKEHRAKHFSVTPSPSTPTFSLSLTTDLYNA